MKSKKIWFWLALLLLVIFRLWLTPKAFHVDLLSQADWGQYLAQTGSSHFYTANRWIYSWPNHPPLTSLTYSFDYQIYLQLSLRFHQSILAIHKFLPPQSFVSYTAWADNFNNPVSPSAPFPYGFLVSLKFIPILGDILIAWLIFKITQKSSKRPYLYSLIYLASPFSWYLSSLWGQTDQISAFFTLLSFWLLPGHAFFSIILFYLGAALKPTSLTLAPLFIFILIKSKPKILPLISGILVCLCLTLITFLPFSPEHNIFSFTFQTLLPRLFDRPPRLTTNSFNFWHLFTLNYPVPSGPFTTLASLIIYALMNIFCIRRLKVINHKSIFVSLFFIGFGSWLFLTNMLDRYSFVGIVSGLILTIYYPKTFFYWLIISFIYWLNLYHGWWYPSYTGTVKNFLLFEHGLVGFIPSLINVITFILFSRHLFRSS